MKDMLYVLRVPTKEQFAYIECEFEGEATDAVEHYQKLTNAVHGGFGIPDKEFNAVLDEYLLDGSFDNGLEQYQRMSVEQQAVIQEVKKALKRIKAKE